MNVFDNLKDRRDATKTLLENELNMLKEHAYNPLHKEQKVQQKTSVASQYEINPDTPWLQSLEVVRNRLQVKSKDDFKTTLNLVTAAAKELEYDSLPIKEVRRKQIKIILEHLRRTRNKLAEGAKKPNIGDPHPITGFVPI